MQILRVFPFSVFYFEFNFWSFVSYPCIFSRTFLAWIGLAVAVPSCPNRMYSTDTLLLYGSLLEFYSPFLSATSCSAFTRLARSTLSQNHRRSFLLFSSSFSLGIGFLCWLLQFALSTCADYS